MSEMEKMVRIERQLRLYEVVCQLAIVQFSDVYEIFQYAPSPAGSGGFKGCGAGEREIFEKGKGVCENRSTGI